MVKLAGTLGRGLSLEDGEDEEEQLEAANGRETFPSGVGEAAGREKFVLELVAWGE